MPGLIQNSELYTKPVILSFFLFYAKDDLELLFAVL